MVQTDSFEQSPHCGRSFLDDSGCLHPENSSLSILLFACMLSIFLPTAGQELQPLHQHT
ncbi:unnamed protein product [Acanthoscelides obtectus]|uniref:Uncharacterized protein n=1 Tax=Acanthoscelides obtectus TaxID=200917 RepID=A0A9P0KH77_ACAOB|nr:unnamed protein product [Acanthoscelides obtectus]CAK1632463.1 hypothetical protein AOBTE_LOCUS7585 [Acanthoscelides obtectus]